jgi:hypothetical protein
MEGMNFIYIFSIVILDIVRDGSTRRREKVGKIFVLTELFSHGLLKRFKTANKIQTHLWKMGKELH